MYVLIVTEVLEDWEDSVNIGKALFVYLSEWGSYGQSSQAVTCLTVAFFFVCLALVILQFLVYVYWGRL